MEELLAKIDGETLFEHTRKVINNSRNIVNNLPSNIFLETIDKDTLLNLVITCALFHDAGKAAVGFQKVLKKQKADWGGKRHEVVSAVLMSSYQDILPEQVLAVLTHHKDIPSDGISDSYKTLHFEHVKSDSAVYQEAIKEWKQNEEMFQYFWNKIIAFFNGKYSEIKNNSTGPAGSFTGTSTVFELTTRAVTIRGNIDNPGGGGSLLYISLDSQFLSGGISVSTGSFDINRLLTQPDTSPISMGTGTVVIRYSNIQNPVALTSGALIMEHTNLFDLSMAVDTSLTVGSIATPSIGTVIILHSFLGGTTRINVSSDMVALFDSICLGVSELNMSGTGASLTIENAFLNTNGGLATTPYNWTSSMGGAMVFISNSAIFVTQGTISVPLIRFINTDARLTALNSHIGTNVVDAMIDLMRIDSRTPDRIAFIISS